jgi:hypothetical protein
MAVVARAGASRHVLSEPLAQISQAPPSDFNDSTLTALEIIPAIAGLSHEAGYHAGETDQCPHWAPSMLKYAINVAIGGKADTD